MSTMYNLEPQPTAKCILHTTYGDLSLELFAQQAPLACRNFLQLCLDGYYDGTIFHRLVPGFIVQGGDPTGTGSGGVSSFNGGEPFADEFHSRLKFNRRGLLGMANAGQKNDNGSQFFLTLDKADELTNKHTLFGRVEGDTIFNLVKMGSADLPDGGGERPLYPTRITGTEILVNPFEGMEKRIAVAQPDAKQDKKKGPKKKAAKGLLSFGDDEGDDVVPLVKPKFNLALANGNGSTAGSKRVAPEGVKERPRKRRATSSPSQSPSPPPQREAAAPVAATQKEPLPLHSRSVSPQPVINRNAEALARTNAQIAELTQSLKRNVPKPVADSGKAKSVLESLIPATATRGRKRKPGGPGGGVSREEQRALDQFHAFKKRLEAAKGGVPEHAVSKKDETANDQATAEDKGPDDEANLCELHFVPNCQSCKKWDDEGQDGPPGEDDDPAGLIGHQLTFEKDRLGKSLEWKRQNEKELVVIDPRERAREYQEEQRRNKGRAK